MLLSEISAFLIVLAYLGVRWQFGRERKVFFTRFIHITMASWLAENTCIHLYAFYSYDTRWHAFIDQVPLAIILIWPVVILSLWDILRYLCVSEKRLPVLLGMAVFADAFFVESVAVHAGLWRWSEPGPFAVPVIGVCGWAFFAAATAHFILRKPKQDMRSLFTHILAVVLSTHAALLATWWGALRWLPFLENLWLWVGLAWLASAVFSVYSFRQKHSSLLPFWCLGCRIPAVSFFVGLCVVHPPDLKLLVFIAAFLPPYMMLTPWGKGKITANLF